MAQQTLHVLPRNPLADEIGSGPGSERVAREGGGGEARISKSPLDHAIQVVRRHRIAREFLAAAAPRPPRGAVQGGRTMLSAFLTMLAVAARVNRAAAEVSCENDYFRIKASFEIEMK